MSDSSVQRRRVPAVVVGAVGLLVVVLTACQPQPRVPIVYDATSEQTTSKASYAVSPVSTSHGPGIEVRMRNCSAARIENLGDQPDRTVDLRPAVQVTDATGKVFFNTFTFAGYWVQPPGSSITRYQEGGPDLQKVVTPTVGAKGNLKVQVACTSYPGYGAGGGYAWTFRSCLTGTRTCNPRTAGVSNLWLPST